MLARSLFDDYVDYRSVRFRKPALDENVILFRLKKSILPNFVLTRFPILSVELKCL